MQLHTPVNETFSYGKLYEVKDAYHQMLHENATRNTIDHAVKMITESVKVNDVKRITSFACKNQKLADTAETTAINKAFEAFKKSFNGMKMSDSMKNAILKKVKVVIDAEIEKGRKMAAPVTKRTAVGKLGKKKVMSIKESAGCNFGDIDENFHDFSNRNLEDTPDFDDEDADSVATDGLDNADGVVGDEEGTYTGVDMTDGEVPADVANDTEDEDIIDADVEDGDDAEGAEGEEEDVDLDAEGADIDDPTNDGSGEDDFVFDVDEHPSKDASVYESKCKCGSNCKCGGVKKLRNKSNFKMMKFTK